MNQKIASSKKIAAPKKAAPRKAVATKAPLKKAAPKKAAPKKAAPRKSTPKPVAPAKAPAKPPKTKLVRDSFTIPKGEYEALQALKERATRLTRPAKKSELLRAGVKLLATLDDKAFLASLAAVPSLKTGRPKG